MTTRNATISQSIEGGNNVSGSGSGGIENWGEMRKITMTAYKG